jgi:fimbrial isopeptide formation D2 family protein/uncharacterized repeat protein (TIGR01451 family)
MYKLKGLLGLSAKVFYIALVGFLFRSGVSYAATTNTYLPSGSTAPNYQQVKMSQDILPNITSDDAGNGDTGGDGLDPVPYRAQDGTLRLWNIYHHIDWGTTDNINPQPSIVCITSGQRCDLNNDGNDDDLYISTNPNHDISQPTTGEYIVTRSYEINSGAMTRGPKLYVPIDVYRSAKPVQGDRFDVGLYCFNMETATSCGYTKLLSDMVLDHIQSNGNIFDPIIGAQMVGDLIYVGADSAITNSDDVNTKVGCFNTVSHTICAAPVHIVSGLPIKHGTHSRMVSLGSRLYISADRLSPDSDISKFRTCLDVSNPSTIVKCPGFATAITTSFNYTPAGSFFVGVPIVLENQYCIVHRAGGTNPPIEVQCYSPANGSILNATSNPVSAEAVLESAMDTIKNHYSVIGTGTYIPAGGEYFYNSSTHKTYIAIRTYVLNPTPTTPSVTICYDNLTGELCAGFDGDNGVGGDGVQFWDEVQTPDNLFLSALDYSYNIDDQGCMWGLGDSGVLYSFDPETAVYPCYRSVAVVDAYANGQLCDPSQGRYVSAKVSNLDWSHVSYVKLAVKNRSTGAEVLVKDVVSDLDTETIDLSSYLTSEYLITLEVHATDDQAWNGNPTLDVVYAPNTTNNIPYGQPGAGEPLTDLTANGCRVSPAISKTNNFNPDEMGIGSTFDYEITVTNNGPSSASTLTVSDTPPQRVEIVNQISYTINGAAPTNGESCSISSGKLSCTLKNVVSTKVDSNSKRVIKYKAQLMSVGLVAPFEDGLPVTNSATVTPVCADQPGYNASSPNCNLTPPTPATSTIDPRVTDIDIKKYITNEFDQSGNPINWRDYNVKVVPGGKVAYKVVVMNNEYLTDHVTGLRIKDAAGNDIKTDSAKNIEVTDKIPAGLSNVTVTHNGVAGITVSPQAAAASPVDVVASAVSISSGQSFEFVTKATYVGESPNTEFLNFVQHSKTTCKNSDGTTVNCSNDGDSNPANCSLQAPKQEDDCGVRGISQEKIYDLEVLKAANNKLPINKVGEEIEYTVKVINNGPADSPGDLDFSDTLPVEVDYISHEVVSGMEGCSFAGGKISCKLLSIKPGEANAATIKIKVKLNSKIKGESFKNTAEVECIKAPSVDSAEQGEVNCDNNKDEEDVDPKLADLSLVKKIRLSNGQLVDTTDSPAVGSVVTYVIQLANSGPDSATNVKVKEEFPDSLEYVSSAPEYGSFDVDTMTWSLPEIAKGVTQNLVITAIYKGGNNVKNIAEIKSSDVPDVDSSPDNCSSAQEDDCDSATIITPGRGIGVPVTGALVGKIIAGATGISLAAYLGRDLMLRHQKKSNSER